MLVNLLVEGRVDEAVGARLLLDCGHQIGTSYGKKGWTYIRERCAVFDKGCVATGLLTLVDFMDTREQCAPGIVQGWVPFRNPHHIFRVVNREIESWILADRDAIADFLGVPIAKIPLAPDELQDPKLTLINLARTSRKRDIRSSLVPEQGLAVSEGPLYSSEIIGFVSRSWNPQRASQHSPSLNRCVQRLKQLP